MSEPKYAHRFPPCSVYDMEAMESWLEDLAGQGLLLSKGGMFCGFAEFIKTTPKAMRYRLQPLPKAKFLEDQGPRAAAVELAEAYGWEYLCNIGDFSVYGTDDPNARELNTDPQVHSMAVRQLYLRKRRDLLWSVFWLLLFIALILWQGPLTFLLQHQIWYNWIYAVLWILFPFVALRELKRLRTLKQKLALGEPLSRSIDWRKNRWRHWTSAFLSIALVLAFYVAWILGSFLDWEDHRWQPVEETCGDYPFATAEILAGSGDFVPTSLYLTSPNHIAERSTLLAARQIKLQQFGDVLDGETLLLDGSLQIDCYEMRTTWLAEALYREIQRTDRSSKHYHAMELPGLPTAQEYAYANVFPTLLLQDGNQVLKVTFSQFNETIALDLDQWASIMAEQFLK